MAQNFNVSPWYDDFEPTKNFHRILFKPGYAVQGRELTQAQTILQNQISNFADSIFSQNTPVTGGKVTINTNCYYLKLTDTYLGVSTVVDNFKNKIITDGHGVLAKVIAVADATGGDPPTLIINYLSGNHFSDASSVIDVDNPSNIGLTIGLSGGSTCTGASSTASISSGVFYVVNGYSQSSTQNSDGSYTKYSIGNFVQVNPDTIFLNKYSNTPSYRIGLEINETVIDYINDSSLLDPAIGASNYQAPGADRYQITLSLVTLPLDIGSDQYFIELVRVVDGVIQKQVDSTVYSVIDDYFAKRTSETNGDFIVNDFKVTPSANTLSSDNYLLTVGPGIAYVNGYRVENQSSLRLVSDRARTTKTVNNNINLLDIGNYIYITGVSGKNGGFFDVSTGTQIDLHIKDTSNIALSNATTYAATQVGTAHIRGLNYVPSAGESGTNTYVYQANLFDISTNVLSGAIASATSTTATFTTAGGKFSPVNDTYNGVKLTIDSGPGTGYVGTITAYNGSTHTVTVTPPFTTTPTSSSNFSLRFAVKDIETIYVANPGTPYTFSANASISVIGKTNGVASGDTQLYETDANKLIYPLGSPYVSSVTNTSYISYQEFRTQSFASYSTGCQKILQLSSFSEDGSLEFFRTGSSEGPTAIKENYLVVVLDRQTNSGINNGDIIDFTAANRSVVVDSSTKQVTFTALDLAPFKATIIAKVGITNANDTNIVLKTKTLVQANTQVASSSGPDGIINGTHVDLTNAQIFIPNGSVLPYGSKQKLYVSDVKRIVKIIDTGGATPTTGMLNSGTDITHYYDFNDGQTDNYYGHSYITLKPGYLTPISVWILFDYYRHSGGDGYFSAQSYTNINIAERPTYTSTTGVTYSLKDCLDFRPALMNAQSNFTFRYSNTPTATNAAGLFLPVPLSSFTSSYSYYLGRKDVLYIGKDKKISILEGTPSINPSQPIAPPGSLTLANITLDPYTAYVPNDGSNQPSSIAVVPVLHKRWSFSEITGLQTRINNLEYYASLNLMEQNAASLQIPDANGLNRFKNGILVDDFSTFGVGNTYDNDFSAAINTRSQILTPALLVKNYPLINEDLLYNENLSAVALNSLNYTPAINGKSSFYMLNYSEESAITQPLASRTTNLNPFAVGNPIGTISLTPPMDNWVDNTTEPDLLFVDNNLKTYRATDTVNVLEGNPTLAIGDWQTIPGTNPISTDDGTNTTTTQAVQNQYTLGNWQTTTATSKVTLNSITGQQQKISSTSYSASGNYLTNLGILPYIRSQFVQFNANGLLFNATVNAFFDGKRVSRLIRKPNIIELSGVTGTFNIGDTIGYISSNVFNQTGTVLDVYVYANGNVRLYVIGDTGTTTYGTTILSGTYNTTGVYQTSKASGTYVSSTHYSGATSSTQSGTTSVQLSQLASSTDIYTGLEFWFVSGSQTGLTTIPKGYKATIVSYNTSTKTITLDTAVSYSTGDVYSIGPLQTNEMGNVSGVFFIPPGYFHTGQRTFRIDNRSVSQTSTEFLYAAGTETTYAEATFYAQGLTTQSQQLNFSSSISSVKNTTTTIDQAIKTLSVTQDQQPGGGGCCVIATALNSHGIWGNDKKFGLIEWCEAKLHDKWWGETLRRGYQVIGSKVAVPLINKNKWIRKYADWQFTNVTNILRGKKFNPLSVPTGLLWFTVMALTGVVVTKKYATKSWTSLYKK